MCLNKLCAVRAAINEQVWKAAKWADFVMNSLQRAPCKPAKMASKTLFHYETNKIRADETMKPKSHSDRDCKQRPKNRQGAFARIWAAIAGTKGRFEQKRFCPRFGTWQ